MKGCISGILTIVFIIASVLIIGCGGGDPITGDKTDRCNNGNFGLNDKGAIVVYPGDYGYILNYRCEECHKVEHRENP